MDDSVYDGTGLPNDSSSQPRDVVAERLVAIASLPEQADRLTAADALYSEVEAGEHGEVDLVRFDDALRAAVYGPESPAGDGQGVTGGDQAGGDGTSYGDAAAGGPDAATVTTPETVAAPTDTSADGAAGPEGAPAGEDAQSVAPGVTEPADTAAEDQPQQTPEDPTT